MSYAWENEYTDGQLAFLDQKRMSDCPWDKKEEPHCYSLWVEGYKFAHKQRIKGFVTFVEIARRGTI